MTITPAPAERSPRAILTHIGAHNMPRIRLAAVIAMLALAPAGNAHEFWIQPGSYSVEGPLRVQLFHGERFKGEVVPRNTPSIKRFEIVTPDGIEPMRGLHGASTSVARPFTSGTGVIVYESREYINLLDAEAFAAYLAEEGLTEIARAREQRGETSEPGREAYVRCAKSIVSARSAPDLAARPVGLPLEITLEQFDRDIVASVVFEQRPLAGMRVVAVNATQPDRLIELRSDDQGKVRFTPGVAGPWMLTTLHMVRTEDRDDVDWKSYWGSITFSIN